MKIFSVAAGVFALWVSAGTAQIVGPFDFESPNQLSNNFRSPLNPGFATQTSSGGNGYVDVNAIVSGPWVGIYDLTPGSSADPSQTFGGAFTIGFDISGANSSSSFGVFLFDDANRNGNNLLTILNLQTNVGGTGTEQIRFWRDTALTTSVVSNQYTTASFFGTNGSYDVATNSWISDATASAVASNDTTSPFTFYHLDFTYDPLASTLTVASSAFSATLNIPAADLITNPGIALRINDAVINDANTAKFDNFAVVPEPASVSLLGMGSLLLGIRRRR